MMGLSLTAVVRGLAALYPYAVDVDNDELVDALVRRLATRRRDDRSGGYGSGIVAAFVPVLLVQTAAPLPFVLFFVLVTPLAAIHTVHSLPHVQAAFRRTEALGATPNLIGRAVLRMQVQPALESAVRFAADTGTGPLKRTASLRIPTGRWERQRRTAFVCSGVGRVVSSASAVVTPARNGTGSPEAERARTLDRALAAVLNGTRSQMAAFTSSIQAPTNGLFAFGIMIPLALIALVPTVPMVGFSVNIWIIVLLYNVVLPGCLVVASGWLLVRRPVAFPPPKIGHDHPDVPDRLWTRALWGLLAGGGSYTATVTFGPAHLASVVAVGFGIGVALLAVYSPILSVRHHVRDVEAHLTDALYIVGRQVAEGESVESAVELAAERVPAETGAVFEHAAGVQQRLHVGVEETFLGRYGARYETFPVLALEGRLHCFAIAADEGKPAGRAIVSMADHLEELADVEAETRRSLATSRGHSTTRLRTLRRWLPERPWEWLR